MANTLYFFECEEGFVADNGQDDVKNGSVENYPPDEEEIVLDKELASSENSDKDGEEKQALPDDTTT